MLAKFVKRPGGAVAKDFLLSWGQVESMFGHSIDGIGEQCLGELFIGRCQSQDFVNDLPGHILLLLWRIVVLMLALCRADPCGRDGVGLPRSAAAGVWVRRGACVTDEERVGSHAAEPCEQKEC